MSTLMKSVLFLLINSNPYLEHGNEDKENEDKENEDKENEDNGNEDSLKIKENLDFISDTRLSFISNILIAAIVFVYVLIGINCLYLFWQFIKIFVCGSNYLFGLLWDSLDKGQEWLQIAVIVSSIAAAWCSFMFMNDMDDRIDNCILKLKTELAEKNAIILKLTAEHTAELNNWETTSDTYSDDNNDLDDNEDDNDSDSECDDDDDCDESSDYDPEDDEY